MISGASIIIVTFNSEATIASCLKSVLATLRAVDEVILIDNASLDNTLDVVDPLIKNYKRDVKVLTQETNLGFARACNIGMSHSEKEFVVLLNPDTVVYGDWISRLTFHFDLYEDTAAVGPLSNYTIATQHATTYLSDYYRFYHEPNEVVKILAERHNKRSVPSKLLIGFCLALRRCLLEKLGGLDEGMFLGIEDLEISWRLREHGFWLRVALDVFVNHTGHKSFESLPSAETDRHIENGSAYLYEKMRTYYNPEPVPHPQDYFGIGWWRPSILMDTPEAEVFAPRTLLQQERMKLLEKVNHLLKERKHQQAIPLLQEAVKKAVNDSRLWYILGSLYVMIREVENAEQALLNAWAIEGDESRAGQKIKSWPRYSRPLKLTESQ